MNSTELSRDIDDIILASLNLKIWNLWTEWSSCSKCDVVGKKTKFGHCIVSYS